MNGLIAQWGLFTGSTVTFPIAFTTTTYSCFFTWNSTDASDHDWAARTWSIWNKTKTGFETWQSWGGGQSSWFAIGK